MKTHPNESADAEAGQYAMFDVRALYEVVRRKIGRIAACMLSGLLLGVAYSISSGDVFEVTATVQVQEENPAIVAIPDLTKEDFKQPEDLKTVEQQLVTRNLIWRVIQANKLDRVPGFFSPGLFSRLQGRAMSQSDMIDSLSRNFIVKLRRGTRLIDITARHRDPAMAQTLARSLIDEAVSQNAEWQANPSKEANKFLFDEAERLRQKVGTAEQALQDYREKNHAVSLDDKQNIIVERLKDLNLRMAKAQNDTLALESDVAQVEKIGGNPAKMLAIGSIANAQSVLDAQRVAAAKEAAFAVLRQRYGQENPAYAQAERELQQVRAALDAAALNAADALRAKYESAKFTQQTSEKMLQEQEQVALDLNRKATQYDALNRNVEADRALFASVVKRLKEMSVIQNINKVHLRVVEPPMVPGTPGMRSKLLAVLIGMFAGAALGFGGVIFRFAARPTIQSPDHAAHILGLPALGAIPQMPRIQGDASRLPGIAEPRSQSAEAFRFLAATTSADAGEKRIALFTGTARGDGSTICAASYAVALARSGVRTLLVDADLRNPAIGPLFTIPKDASGLADCLAGRCDLAAAVVATKVENLFVLVAGSSEGEISSLFSGPGIGDLLGRAAGEYGQVVIDSAPVNLASETLLLARHATTTCLVLRTGRTAITAASRACQLLDNTGHPPTGFILNRVPRRMLG